MHRPAALLATATILTLAAPAAPSVQEPEPPPFAAEGIPAAPLPNAPVVYDTAAGNASGSRR